MLTQSDNYHYTHNKVRFTANTVRVYLNSFTTHRECIIIIIITIVKQSFPFLRGHFVEHVPTLCIL